MNKKLKMYIPIIYALMGLTIVLVAAALIVDINLFLFSGFISVAVFGFVLLRLNKANRQVKKFFEAIGEEFNESGKDSLEKLPVPVLLVYENGETFWYNDAARLRMFDGQDHHGEDIKTIIPDVDLLHDCPRNGYAIHYGDRFYTAFTTDHWDDDKRLSMVILVDDTDLKYFASEYAQTRQSVGIIQVDNIDELQQSIRESERAQLMGEVEEIIEQYFTEHDSFIIRKERDKFIAIIYERDMEKILSQRFDLLDRVREVNFGDNLPATLSIGVGRGAKSLTEAENMARQALDMALGRGGDQAAIRNKNGYEFYGGVFKGVEKRTKVKTRIVATALRELMETSGNILIMGHRFADLDSAGSAVGMLKVAKDMGKNAAVVIDRQQNLVKPLIEKMLRNGYAESDFLDPDNARILVDKRTLLIIVDTHSPFVVESSAIYEACSNVVVIDHHRKAVNYIENAVIFYHEPYASSASEMVTELIQYFPASARVGRMEANALLAGITLDTKNFVMRTGVRTFEAAAYLRRLGADTIEVKKLFSSSRESYMVRTGLVSRAEIYRSCAISVSEADTEDIKTVAPQAADDLLGIREVDASFVIYEYDDKIAVSARSMGLLNVQLIMERLGGGGHHTMAAAQFTGKSKAEVREELIKAIDQYCQDKDHPVNGKPA